MLIFPLDDRFYRFHGCLLTEALFGVLNHEPIKENLKEYTDYHFDALLVSIYLVSKVLNTGKIIININID